MVRLRQALVLALFVALPAQAESERDPREARAAALLDEFHRVMPRSPGELRAAAVRTARANEALPVLRQLRVFVSEHRDSPLAARGLEFSVYSLVLGDEALRAALAEQRTAGDAGARLLLESSAVIVAADAAQRASAVAAVAATLREAGKPAPVEATDCAVRCLVMAGDLSESEARQLAASAVGKPAGAQFAAAAEAAAKDPRRRLDQPVEFAGKLASGEAFTTASLRGKVVLIDFWATWCQPCVRGLPELVRLQREFGPRGFAVVGVSSDRESAALAKFLAAHPEIDWPQLVEPDREGFHPLAERFGITAIPRLFLVDRKGVLRSVDAHGKLDELIARLLAE